MNRFLIVLSTVLIILFGANNAFAFDPPQPTNYVVDMAGKLTPDQLTALNAKLDSLNKTTKNEFAGLIIQSLNGESIQDVANATFKAWKIGKAGLDNGVLLVIAIADRKSRIETGKGVEGDLTDLQASDILKNTLAPYLKRDDFYGGLNATFDSISSNIESRSRAVVAAPTPTNNGANKAVITGFGVVGGVILLFIVAVNVTSSRNNARQRRLQEAEEAEEAEEQVRRMRAQSVRDQEERRKKLEAAVRERESRERAKQVKRLNKQSKALAKKAANAQKASVSNKPITRSGHIVDNDVHIKPVKIKASNIATTAVVGGVTGVAVSSFAQQRNKEAAQRVIEEARRKRLEREEADRRRRAEEDRRRREEEDRRRRAEEDKRRREEEEEDRRRSSYSSSSSFYDWGSSSSSSGFGGFGGGDSGGGGSSGDW